MRKIISSVAVIAALSFGAASGAYATALPGLSTQYNAMIAACSGPAGSKAACEAAIAAYTDAALAGGFSLADTAKSFKEARAEIKAANSANPTLLAAIEGSFDTLLPGSGSVGGGAGTDDGFVQGQSIGSGGGTPASAT